MKFFIKTYGCAFNQADSENIEFFLKVNGHEPVESEDEADVVIFNTCGVKDSTESRIVNEIKNCEKKMVVTGCLAQVQPKKILKLSPNLSIAGTFNNTKILDCFTDKGVWTGKGLNVAPNPKVNGVVSIIQLSTGCLGNCTFCQTKLARGGLKSFSEAGIVSNVKKVVEKGCKEVRLSSQDLGCYGFDFGSSLPSLLEKIIEIEGDFKVRLGMMNPEHAIEIKDSLSKLLKNDKIYSFVHIPVQSGSDSVLEKMERNYTVEDFRNVVNFLKANSSDLTVETDFIVGFPNETEEDFNSSIELMKGIRFDIVNLSKFSSRKNTKASFMKQLSKNEIKRRSVESSKIYKRISLEKNLEMIGRTEEVMIIEKAKSALLARTNSYKPVLVSGSIGDKLVVKITSAGQSHLKGEII